MRLFHGYENAEIARPTVMTLGVFDGLHLGHQLIISTVVERARAVGAVPTVITFDPHPRAVLHPESAPPLLQTFDQKIEAFGVLGVEQTIVVRFTRDFAQIRADEWINYQRYDFPRLGDGVGQPRVGLFGAVEVSPGEPDFSAMLMLARATNS